MHIYNCVIFSYKSNKYLLMNKIKTTVVTVIITLVFYCAIFNTKSSYADDKELPLVSVIMPIWNSKKFINQAVDSVINQTYKNLEILLVNDGSTDGSGELFDELPCFISHDTVHS